MTQQGEERRKVRLLGNQHNESGSPESTDGRAAVIAFHQAAQLTAVRTNRGC